MLMRRFGEPVTGVPPAEAGSSGGTIKPELPGVGVRTLPWKSLKARSCTFTMPGATGASGSPPSSPGMPGVERQLHKPSHSERSAIRLTTNHRIREPIGDPGGGPRRATAAANQRLPPRAAA